MWAETGFQPHGTDDLRQQLVAQTRPGALPEDTWAYLAAWCLYPHPALNIQAPDPPQRAPLANVYRDLYANPFCPLAWKPEWFTSTVRDLAAHIYDARDFSAMPILADAL